MICLEITVNGKGLCRAGIEGASLLVPMLSVYVGTEGTASLSVSGMCNLPGGQSAFVHWLRESALSSGDTVRFEIIKADDPTAPLEVIPADSPEQLERQRQFEALEKVVTPIGIPAARRWPTAGFRCSVNEEHKAKVYLAPTEEHILCLLSWNSAHPERCHVRVWSYGGSDRRRNRRETDWLRTWLHLGDTLDVEVSH